MTTLRTHRLSHERPYPGLRPYGFEDHEYFFGREDQTYALYRLTDRSRFVAVVGSSGSGKSSLVRAGLQPLMEQETMGSGGRRWLQAEMRPGDAPMQRLIEVLASLAKGDDPVVATARRERIAFHLRDSYGIEEALGEIKTIGNASVLLVIDQFEELFRYIAFPRRNRREEASSRDEAVRFVQILLQASRSRACNVHVLLTMRSDFIGDCSRFQGLPEAVSAAQFLVPSLTRDQLEEAIRGPAEHAGAAVESALVNTLINDSNEELDQLPVLQHCLLRMWECAGADAGGTQEPGTVPDGDAGSGGAPIRTLTVEHYDRIGRTNEALSQHADEVLAGLAGHEMAVEQVFRALAEVDKEGRATRRAVKFSQLLAETGIPEEELRLVVDRYREDDCSFLVPSQSIAPKLELSTRVDVGHEALLRRWRRVSGDPDSPLDFEVGQAQARGWLQDEQRDGKQYRDLLGRLEDGELPLKKFDARLGWWRSRPRTPAWGTRYGGKLDEVNQLFERTVAKKKRVAGYRAAGAVASVVIAVLAGGAVKLTIDEKERLTQFEVQSKSMQAQAEHNYRIVANSTRSLLGVLFASLRNDKVPPETARRLLEIAESWIDEHKVGEKNAELRGLEAEVSLLVSDIAIVLGDEPKALAKAKLARGNAMTLVGSGAIEPQEYMYQSTFRIADVVVKTDKPAAQRDYVEAVGIAKKLWGANPEEYRYGGYVSFALGKVGEALELQGQIAEALKYFDEALGVATALYDKNPNNSEWSRLRAAAHAKIGKALIALHPPQLDNAIVEIEKAIAIQARLVSGNPDDNAPFSNLAISHKTKADLLVRRSDRESALKEYMSAVTIWEALASKSPGDMRWQVYLAPTHEALGDSILERDPKAARLHYERAEAARRSLVEKSPNSASMQKELAAIQQKLNKLDVMSRTPEVTGSTQR